MYRDRFRFMDILYTRIYKIMEKRRNKSESEISEKSLFLSLLSLFLYIKVMDAYVSDSLCEICNYARFIVKIFF
jgi:hypothetical protein